jgi:hypothetical protein
MVPSIHFKYLLMVSCKRPRLFSLPEDASTCPYEIVMEEALMEGALPALTVKSFQGFPGRQRKKLSVLVNLNRKFELNQFKLN